MIDIFLHTFPFLLYISQQMEKTPKIAVKKKWIRPVKERERHFLSACFFRYPAVAAEGRRTGIFRESHFRAVAGVGRGVLHTSTPTSTPEPFV
jgi:hypothetical protein